MLCYFFFNLIFFSKRETEVEGLILVNHSMVVFLVDFFLDGSYNTIPLGLVIT